MRRRPSVIVMAVLGGAALLAAALFLYQGGRRGSETDPGLIGARRFGAAFVSALNADDADALGQLIGATPDAEKVRQRLDRYGGQDLHAVTVTAGSEFPHVYLVDINATGRDGSTIAIHEVIEWNGTGWDVALLGPEESEP